MCLRVLLKSLDLPFFGKIMTNQISFDLLKTGLPNKNKIVHLFVF